MVICCLSVVSIHVDQLSPLSLVLWYNEYQAFGLGNTGGLDDSSLKVDFDIEDICLFVSCQ